MSYFDEDEYEGVGAVAATRSSVMPTRSTTSFRRPTASVMKMVAHRAVPKSRCPPGQVYDGIEQMCRDAPTPPSISSKIKLQRLVATRTPSRKVLRQPTKARRWGRIRRPLPGVKVQKLTSVRPVVTLTGVKPGPSPTLSDALRAAQLRAIKYPPRTPDRIMTAQPAPLQIGTGIGTPPSRFVAPSAPRQQVMTAGAPQFGPEFDDGELAAQEQAVQQSLEIPQFTPQPTQAEAEAGAQRVAAAKPLSMTTKLVLGGVALGAVYFLVIRK